MVRRPTFRALTATVTALCFGLTLAPVQALAMTAPFSAAQQIESDDLSAFTKWTSLMPRYDVAREEAEPCKPANDEDPIKACMSDQWDALLEKIEDEPVRKQLQAVNDFFNKVTYIDDIDNWGVDDYWATPQEFMQRGGDCEDYAIAKYISLKRLGVDEDDMRILIVSDQNLNGQMHAVLEVTINDVAYILDNQADQVIRADRIFHYTPIYAINEQSWWAYLG